MCGSISIIIISVIFLIPLFVIVIAIIGSPREDHLYDDIGPV